MKNSTFSLSFLQLRQKVEEGKSITQVYDIIRKQWVKAQPEEIVRQKLVRYMIDHLGYPQSLMIVEREFFLLPHLALQGPATLPQRRADILCFAQNLCTEFPLYPLLMIECKAVTLNAKTLRQVIGYNTYIKARFIAIANGEKIQVGWYDAEKEDYYLIDFLPSYKELVTMVQQENRL